VFGFCGAGYGRIGHSVQKDEFAPKKLEALSQRVKASPDSLVKFLQLLAPSWLVTVQKAPLRHSITRRVLLALMPMSEQRPTCDLDS